MSIKNFYMHQPLTVDAGAGYPPAVNMTQDSLGSGLAFVEGELEKLDPKLNEPLTSVTWPRDIVAVYGGGYIEYTSNFFANYATTGQDTDAFINGQTNDIPIIQADIQKDIWRVFTWSNILRVPFIDQQFLNQVSRSLNDIFDRGIKLSYQKALDRMVYVSYPEKLGAYGLLNNPAVLVTTADTGANGSTEWATKSANEILADWNTALTYINEVTEYDPSALPNHVLLPPRQFGWLVSQLISSAGNNSILNFLNQNNFVQSQGGNLVVVSCRWCIGAGVGGTDRAMFYNDDERFVHFNIPVPLSRVMTQPLVNQMSYHTAYVSQIGEVKFLYPQTALYVDGI